MDVSLQGRRHISIAIVWSRSLRSFLIEVPSQGTGYRKNSTLLWVLWQEISRRLSVTGSLPGIYSGQYKVYPEVANPGKKTKAFRWPVSNSAAYPGRSLGEFHSFSCESLIQLEPATAHFDIFRQYRWLFYHSVPATKTATSSIVAEG
jgi:hypothetical protein